MVNNTAALKQYTYARHKPEETTLYKIVQNNWLSFQEQVGRDAGYPLPDFVVKEFEEYLRCGILAHGFLRAQCESCHFEHLVAFSCKRRGFCPSCGARRMSETAAHLVDSVLPQQPIRQWVLSFPFQIRLCRCCDGSPYFVVAPSSSGFSKIINEQEAAGVWKKQNAPQKLLRYVEKFHTWRRS